MVMKLQCLYSHIADIHCVIYQGAVTGFCSTHTVSCYRIGDESWLGTPQVYDVEGRAVETFQLPEFEICYLDDCENPAINSWLQTNCTVCTILDFLQIPRSVHFSSSLEHSYYSFPSSKDDAQTVCSFYIFCELSSYSVPSLSLAAKAAAAAPYGANNVG